MKVTRSIFMFVVFMLCDEHNGCTSTMFKKIDFIYDKMDMTANDIDWLLGNIDTIINKLSNDWMNLVVCSTFYTSYHPNNGEPLNSTSLRNNLKITVQATLETLLQQLRVAPSYSVIFVITNATKPSNAAPIDLILEEIQNKRIQFTEAIYLRLTYQPQEIRTFSLQKINSDVSFCTHADPFLGSALNDLKWSNCSAKECERVPGNPWRSIMTNLIEKGDEVTNYESFEETLAKTCSFKKPVVSTWFHYIGFTRSDYDFDYGFTIEDVVSLDDTYRKPINGMRNKIYVSLTDKNFEHGVDHFKILFLNETQFGENIAVKQILGTDLFVGSFDPPKKEYFYVEVTSYVNNETTVSRISSTAVNAAEGFGDDHDNRIFEHRPIFKRQPVSSKSYDNYDAYYFFIGVLLVLLVFIKCRHWYKQGENPHQGLKVDKDRYRTVSTVNRV
ncbi:uncharacterized protein LOC135837617 isoform X2 [Planococcus citri]|uniref:uncharacterized protein LOC135837617 isoform X2 n=1 Tax=Planococcus citri TaxID=170843 RepID=UPI0031FA25B5